MTFRASQTSVIALCAILALTGCGGGSGGSSGQSVSPPSPAPTPAPTPAPPPPSPPPPPTPTGPDVLSEGDSISVFWGGNHTGIYASTRPNLSFRGLAVGGSGMAQLEARKAVVLNAHPKVVTVFDCANDMLNFATAQDFVTVLFSYVADVRATGAKVAVATVSPRRSLPSRASSSARLNAVLILSGMISKSASRIKS